MKKLATSFVTVASATLWLGVEYGSPATAQTLPRMNVSPAANGKAVITWPYTNSGFVFQETTNLNVAAWSVSALFPGFTRLPKL